MNTFYKNKIVPFIIAFSLMLIKSPFPVAAEPSLADYTSYPIFMSSQVKPNIMILMDNSGSMNFNAYGTWPGTDGIVADEPYSSGNIDIRVNQSMDDAEERTSTGDTSWYNNSDLDLGGFSTTSNDSVAGIRFKGLGIPKGATISTAYITFEAYANSSTAQADTDFVINGIASDDATWFPNNVDEISSRPVTTASVAWDNVPAWTAGATDQTPELKTIVQELVNRAGWTTSSSIAFKITGTGKRDARPYDYGDHTHGPVLHVEYVGTPEYYGYFDPTSRYTYSSGVFKRSTSGAWSGNFLNWLCMRRIDIARKVMMGGLAETRTYTGTQNLTGENSSYTRDFRKRYDGSGTTGITPYNGGTYEYRMEGKYIKVYTTGGTYQATYTVVVEKVAADEPNDFEDLGSGLTTVGLVQRFGPQARWGNAWFNNGYTGYTGANGGFIANGITDGASSTLIDDLQDRAATTWTPLAEAYYTATQYFAQNAISGLNYPSDPGTTSNDPFTGSAYCAKNFVILLTDGASTMDGVIPSAIMDYADAYDSWTAGDHVAGDCSEYSGSGCEYGSAGTDYLKDVALWARTTDLRPDGDADGLQDPQNIILYAIYAFGNEENARNLLKDAAKNGGFTDRDGDNVPDGNKDSAADDRLEWDEDGDGIPDTYFEASNGREMERQLGKAIRDILERAASGTAASVLATNSEGEGNLVQAYFRPTSATTTTQNASVEVSWIGYLQSLWLDPCGNLREDSNGNRTLDLVDTGSGIDPIIEYYFDSNTSDTKIRRFSKHPRYTYPTYCSIEGVASDYAYDTIELDEIVPLFESGRLLALANPADRKIFTYIDKNEDEAVDEATYDNLDAYDEMIAFSTANATALTPYLGLVNGTIWSYMGSSHTDRVSNLINYIRGTDFFDANGKPILRNRTSNEIDGLDDDTVADNIDYVWKLGDIVHSTPVTVSKPTDNYHIVYSDQSYQYYMDAVKDRETVTYVGANDGMLHAFTSWKYNSSTRTYEYPLTAPAYNQYDATPGMQLGSELWAYIPQSVLPHLKFLADPDYTHTYYVDQKPKVFDAKILPNGTHYNRAGYTGDNWGTFLLVGLNFGGKRIWTHEFGVTGTDTRFFDPSYVLIDITEPRNPVVMWERSYSGLGLSQSTPAIAKVGDKWFAVFGSGPTDYDGTSTQTGKIFVVDLKTGEPYKSGTDDWLYETSENYAFMNSPTALDKNLNYNVDAIYFGETYCASAACNSPDTFEGKVYKLQVNCSPCDWESIAPVYEDNPSLWAQPSVLFDAGGPITAPIALSVDSLDNAWLYFGTGRYIRDEDKTNQDQQYIVGLKDPFFNSLRTSNYHNFSSSYKLLNSDLLDVDDIVVTTQGAVFNSSGTPYGSTGLWYELLSNARAKDGWIRSLETSSGPSDRSVSKSAVLGGIVLTPTFVPNSDVCEFGGATSFYGLYFETGTAFKKDVFDAGITVISYGGDTYNVVDVKLSGKGVGAPPPAIGLHAGRQKGAKAFLQLSTGEILMIDVDTALSIKSGITTWQQQ